MYKKLIGILVMLLLITASALQVVGTKYEVTTCKNNYKTYEPLDRGWYWKPSYPNYAPNGIPDISQRQRGWKSITDGGNNIAESTAIGDDVQVVSVGNPVNRGSWIVAPGPNCNLDSSYAGDDLSEWSFGGPVAVANCFWWIDSKYGNPDGIPGDGEDEFPLVEDYGSGDDHAVDNVPLLIEKLANAMNTTAGGTFEDAVNGIEKWLVDVDLDDLFKVNLYEYPTFDFVGSEIEHDKEVILIMGCHNQIDDGCLFLGHHIVNCMGVNLEELMIAISDPFYDLENPDGNHNDALNVSHDIYDIEIGSPCSEVPGEWWLPEYCPHTDYTIVLYAIIINPLNEPPDIPSITGQTNGKKGKEYEYTFNAVDPDSDDVKYYIDWGDGEKNETGFYTSGMDVKVNHSWNNKGSYNITVKAKDINGFYSLWTSLEIIIPRTRVSSNTFLLQFLNRFSNAFPILRHSLELFFPSLH